MSDRKHLGYIVGGGLKDKFRARLSVSSHEVQEGAFVGVTLRRTHE